MTAYVLLLLIFATISIMGYVIKQKNISPKYITIFFCSSILVFIMAFRAATVGADTKQYCYGFRQIAEKSIDELYTTPVYSIEGPYEQNFEVGYISLNKIVSIFSTNQQAITIVTSIIIIALLSALIAKRSKNPSMSFWLYLTLGIFQTQMNMSRNAIAILICYLAFIFIEQKKPLKYTLSIVSAALFHRSALLFLPLYYLKNKTKITPKNTQIYILLSIVIGVFLFLPIASFLQTILPSSLTRYITSQTTRYEGLIVGLFNLAIVWLTIKITGYKYYKKRISDMQTGIWMVIFNTFMISVGYNLSAATRIAALFGPYLLLFIPNIIVSPDIPLKRQRVATLIIAAICGLQFIARLCINNIGGTMPYAFFWQG